MNKEIFNKTNITYKAVSKEFSLVKFINNSYIY